MNAKKNPNFSNNVKYIDIELPEQEIYCPPLTIRVVDCRSFGRYTLVGTHTSNSIHKFLYQPVTMSMKQDEEKRRAQSIINNFHQVHAEGLEKLLSGDTSPAAENTSLLKSKETLISLDYGTYHASTPGPSPTPNAPANGHAGGAPEGQGPQDQEPEEDEESMDWWSKYFASLDTLIEESKANRTESIAGDTGQENREKPGKKKKTSMQAFKSVT